MNNKTIATTRTHEITNRTENKTLRIQNDTQKRAQQLTKGRKNERKKGRKEDMKTEYQAYVYIYT